MEISDIKQRLSILTVLQHYNLKPDRNNHIKCPFHEDDNQAAGFTMTQILFIVLVVGLQEM